MTPPLFYSDAFLSDCRWILNPGGVLLHNLHTGSSALDSAFASAAAAYARTFPAGAAVVPVVGQGNTILCASGAEAIFRAATTAEVCVRWGGWPLGLAGACSARGPAKGWGRESGGDGGAGGRVRSQDVTAKGVFIRGYG